MVLFGGNNRTAGHRQSNRENGTVMGKCLLKSSRCTKIRKSCLAAALIAAGFVFFIPQLVWASGGGEGSGHEPGLSTLIFPVINFVIYLGIMVFAYFKLAKGALRERSVSVEENLKRSAEALALAQSEFAEMVKRLDALELEKIRLRDEFREEGRRMQEAIRAASEKTKADIQREAARRIENELKKAKADIRSEVVGLAARLARERLQRDLSGMQDQRLREETVAVLRS
jgi:F-type H+-transporting ATPase subunit b